MIPHSLRPNHAIILTILLLLLPPSNTWDISPKLQNGVYEIRTQHSKSNSGHHWPQVHIAHYAIDPYTNYTAVKDHSRIPKLKNLTSECTTGDATSLDHQNILLARAMLENWCEGFGPKPKAVLLSVYNGMAWYMCNWRVRYKHPFHPQYCSRKEVVNASDFLDLGCGEDKMGYQELRYWHKRYGRAKAGTCICDDIGLDHVESTELDA
ncbi:hypothetical protein QQS21_003785 [Conoideocrella luteorostrata]|uniref:Uncharacterized protein n=1 Tax=Conoideocrella luteorostrata TaxID=1105319 RepID=A0AAJ0CSN4_9HYPO|nr:hypothetical protein QQS21_003785 [Conoideocrella luteorostrata]